MQPTRQSSLSGFKHLDPACIPIRWVLVSCSSLHGISVAGTIQDIMSVPLRWDVVLGRWRTGAGIVYARASGPLRQIHLERTIGGGEGPVAGDGPVEGCGRLAPPVFPGWAVHRADGAIGVRARCMQVLSFRILLCKPPMPFASTRLEREILYRYEVALSRFMLLPDA